MIYYIALLIYILLLAFFTSYCKNKRRGRKVFFFFVCVGVILFQGFRSFSVGTDLASYLPAYTEIGFLGNKDFHYLNYEIGYVFLNKILFQIGVSERLFLIVLAAMIQIPIFQTIYRYSDFPLLSILWYFAFGNFIMTFSGLRQSIAMSICFFAYHYIKEKKFFRFCFAIVVASLFHLSALFCLILYPLYYLKLDKKKFIGMLGSLLIIFLFRKPIFSLMSQLYYGEAKEMTATGAYTMFAVYLLIFILSFLGNTKEDLDFIGLRNILLVLAMIYSFASLHDYVTRIGYPLTLYMTLFVPKLVNRFRVVPKSVYNCICCIAVIACFFYFLGGLDTLPFSFG